MDAIDERGNTAMTGLGLCAAVVFALAGCSSTSDDLSTARDAVECTTPVVQAAGPADQHCEGRDPQPVLHDSCHGTTVAHGDHDHPAEPEQSATLYNAEGDDDDCKYHVKWAVTPACAKQEAYFSLQLIQKVDGMAASGANPTIDLALDDTHLAPNTGPVSVETAPGNYTIGPVVFDASGRWTARFHMYDDCNDVLEDSPHGHVTFYVDVP